MSSHCKSRANRGNSKRLLPTPSSRESQNRNVPSSKHISPDEMTSKDFYMDEHAHFRAHEKLLKDEITMLAYKNAIFHNQHLFKGKIVLDVGCGTGILSMLAAKAGAAKVIAYEKSRIAIHTKKIIAANNLSSVIKVVSGSIEKVRLPEGLTKVDIIISDWMGYCLFYKSKIDPVLYARDKWLKLNGLIFPDRCTLFIAAVEHRQFKNYKINWWDNVYGFNMDEFRKSTLSEPVIATVDSKHMVTDSFLIKEVDLYTAKIGTFKFASQFALTASRNDYVQALVTYFNVEFTKSHKFIGFSTSPEKPYTHWKQTIFYLDRSLTVQKGEQIFGKFTLQQKCRNSRELDLKIGVKFDGNLSHVIENNQYKMV